MGSEFLPKQFSREAKKPSKLFASDEPFIIPPSSETVDKKELPAEIPPADYALPGFGTKPKQLAIQSKNSEAQSESVLDNGEKQLQTSQNKSGDKKKGGGDWLPKSVQWVWGVLQGDFNKNPSTSQVVVRTLITLIPGIDQVADVQDLIASLYILAWERKYDDFGAWFNLFLTGIGLIPTVGSAFKGVVKTLKTSDNVNLAAITKLLGPLANKLDSLGNFSTYTNQAAGHVKKVIGNLTNKVAETANTLREYISFDPTGKLRPFINKLDEFNNSLKSIRASIDDKFRQIGEEIQQQLDKLLGGNGQLATANGAPLPKRGSEIDQGPELIKGRRIVSQHQTTSGHTIKIASDGRIFRCSNCEDLEKLYKDVLDSNEDLKRWLDTIKKDPTNPQLSSQLVKLEERLENVDKVRRGIFPKVTKYGSNKLTKFRKHQNDIRLTAQELGIEIPKGVKIKSEEFQKPVEKFINDIVQTGETRQIPYKEYTDALWSRRGNALVIRQADGTFVTFLNASTGGAALQWK